MPIRHNVHKCVVVYTGIGKVGDICIFVIIFSLKYRNGFFVLNIKVTQENIKKIMELFEVNNLLIEKMECFITINEKDEIIEIERNGKKLDISDLTGLWEE